MTKEKIISRIYQGKIFVWQPFDKKKPRKGGTWWLVEGRELSRPATNEEFKALSQMTDSTDTPKEGEHHDETEEGPEVEVETGSKYADAKRTRKKSFTSLMTQKLLDGNGIKDSFKGTFSDKFKARMTGIKEFFDPMSMIKKLTGGSKLAAAMYGSARGRSKEDMNYFAGGTDKEHTEKSKNKAQPISGGTATKVNSMESGNEMLDALNKIYSFMTTTDEKKVKQKELENNRSEENAIEAQKRHKELIDAIKGVSSKPSGKPTAEKVNDPVDTPDIIDTVLGMFGLTKESIQTVAKITTFLASAAGSALVPILIGAAPLALLGGAAYLAADDGKGGNTEGQTKVMNKIQDVSGFKKTEATLVPDEDLEPDSIFKNNGAKKARKANIEKRIKEQLSPFKPEDVPRIKKAYDIDVPKDQIETASPVKSENKSTTGAVSQQNANSSSGGETSANSTVSTVSGAKSDSNPAVPTPSASNPSASVSPSTSASPVTPPPSASGKMNSLTKANNDAEIEAKTKQSSTSVTNNSVTNNSTSKTSSKKTPLMAVRNQEETLQRMIVGSTRLV